MACRTKLIIVRRRVGPRRFGKNMRKLFAPITLLTSRWSLASTTNTRTCWVLLIDRTKPLSHLGNIVFGEPMANTLIVTSCYRLMTFVPPLRSRVARRISSTRRPWQRPFLLLIPRIRRIVCCVVRRSVVLLMKVGSRLILKTRRLASPPKLVIALRDATAVCLLLLVRILRIPTLTTFSVW